jgi:hypothetical protein
LLFLAGRSANSKNWFLHGKIKLPWLKGLIGAAASRWVAISA